MDKKDSFAVKQEDSFAVKQDTLILKRITSK